METVLQLYCSVLFPDIDHICVFGTLKTNFPLETVSLFSFQNKNTTLREKVHILSLLKKPPCSTIASLLPCNPSTISSLDDPPAPLFPRWTDVSAVNPSCDRTDSSLGSKQIQIGPNYQQLRSQEEPEGPSPTENLPRSSPELLQSFLLSTNLISQAAPLAAGWPLVSPLNSCSSPSNASVIMLPLTSQNFWMPTKMVVPLSQSSSFAHHGTHSSPRGSKRRNQ